MKATHTFCAFAAVAILGTYLLASSTASADDERGAILPIRTSASTPKELAGSPWDQYGFDKTQVDIAWTAGVSYRFGR